MSDKDMIILEVVDQSRIGPVMHQGRVSDTTLSILLRFLRGRKNFRQVSKGLANFDLLPVLDRELEVLRSLKDQDDSASEAEAAHLLCFQERLAVKDG